MILVWFNILGVLAKAPKMLWTDCPDDSSCNRCLDIAFESENDIACLHQKYPENGCVFEGALMNSGSIIAISSDQCFVDSTLKNIQGLHTYFEIRFWKDVLSSSGS